MSCSDEAIYRELRSELVRYASALVGPDEGPDLLSAVITRTLARRRLCDLDDPRLYLFRAVGNEARTFRRRSQRQVVQATVPDLVAPPPGDEDVELVMTLPVRQRAAAYLVYWLGYEPIDAARLMGCRPATVRRYLHLVRIKLKEALDAQD